MTRRPGLSCSVDWDSSFSKTEMTAPAQSGGKSRKIKRETDDLILFNGSLLSVQKLNRQPGPTEWVKMSPRARGTHYESALRTSCSVLRMRGGENGWVCSTWKRYTRTCKRIKERNVSLRLRERRRLWTEKEGHSFQSNSELTDEEKTEHDSHSANQTKQHDVKRKERCTDKKGAGH